MHREQFARSRIAPISLFMFLFVCNARVVQAQASETPLLPMNVEFRYLPQYIEQSTFDDPRYARIEALLTEDSCDVILLDKTTNREAFYSISKLRVDSLAANGSDAYITPIGFTASRTKELSSTFLIHFQDHFGNEISWNFVVGKIVPHASPEVIYRTDNSGITFLYAPYRAPTAGGTVLRIAGREYLPGSAGSDALVAFYATDMTLGQILPGTDLWAVEHSPTDTLTPTWSLVGNGGRQRTLTLKARSTTEASIEQSEVSEPDAPQITLDVVRVNDSYELRSVSFESHFNKLWMFFSPSLPLPSHDVVDKRIVTFTVAENEQANIASGELEVRRSAGVEHMLWQFDTPRFARAITLETGVNLVPSARVQENCVEDCLDLLR